MSSEMRELIAKWRSEVDGGPDRELKEIGYDACLLDCADELEALLARTEAGADGAVAWLCEWTDEDDGETVRVSFEFKRGAENRALEVGGDARVIPLYTHPQDASGDAERYRWLRTALYSQNLDIGEAELSLHFYGAAPALEQFDAAIDAAMQAKEAK